MKSIRLYLLFISLAVFSCKTASISSSKKGDNQAITSADIDTQLEKYRLQVPAPISLLVPTAQNQAEELPQQNNTGLQPINERIDLILKQMSERKITNMSGFRVQLYSSAKRDGVEDFIKSVKEVTSEPVSMNYEQPNYKVKVGAYLTRLDAYRSYVNLKSKFPMAIIIPDNINLDFVTEK